MWDIFTEALLSNTLWQFASEVRYFAMLAFGGQDMLLPTLLAIAGALLGCMANFYAGVFLSTFYEGGHFKLAPETYARWQRRAEWMIWPVGMLSWIHLVGVLVFGAGFLRIAPWKVLLAVSVGQTAYYFHHYLTSTGALNAS